MTNLATFIWFLEKWHYLKVMGVIQSNFWEASYGAYYIFTQNYVEAKLLEPLLWNFAWVNGRSCAFRQNQSGYPNVNTLGTIKVLLVAVAFEIRVLQLKTQNPNKNSQNMNMDFIDRKSLLICPSVCLFVCLY